MECKNIIRLTVLFMITINKILIFATVLSLSVTVVNKGLRRIQEHRRLVTMRVAIQKYTLIYRLVHTAKVAREVITEILFNKKAKSDSSGSTQIVPAYLNVG
jgi:hypothetical protein